MKSFGQFCPVAQASEILSEKWTLLILRDLIAGSLRFNELRRGVPLMSPSLLSKRLKRLVEAGVIERHRVAGRGAPRYRLSASGREIRPIVELFGAWGQRWVRDRLGEDKFDVGLLMWAITLDLRGGVDADLFAGERTVIQYEFSDLAGPRKTWWLIVEPSDVDLCFKDPGFDVDLFVTTDLGTLTKAWMGDVPIGPAVRSGAIELHGSRRLARGFETWMRRSPFAAVERPPSGA